MRLTAMVVAALALLASLGFAQIPTEFALYQSEPDPFCPEEHGHVLIPYDTPQDCYVLIQIWDPEGTSVVRSIEVGMVNAGHCYVVWNGLTDSGAMVDEGVYPCTLTATEYEGGPVLFEDTMFITVYCGAPVNKTSWGRLKALFA